MFVLTWLACRVEPLYALIRAWPSYFYERSKKVPNELKKLHGVVTVGSKTPYEASKPIKNVNKPSTFRKQR